jgi:hypothetical protein
MGRREIHVRVDDGARFSRALVLTDERVDEALPSQPRYLEEEAVERPPVVVEKPRRLTELVGQVARRQIGPLERLPLLQQIAHECRSSWPGDRSHVVAGSSLDYSCPGS